VRVKGHKEEAKLHGDLKSGSPIKKAK
jgi:hypothetical protein